MYTILRQCGTCSGFTSLPLEIKCQKCKQGRPNLAVLVLSSSRCIDIREASTNSCSSIHLEYTKVVRPVIHSFIRLFAQQGRRQKLMEGVSTFLPSPSPFLPPLPCPFPSLPIPLEVGLLKPAAWGSAEPRPKINLVHSGAVRKPLVAIILSILKCMFYITWRKKLDWASAGECSDTPSPPCVRPCCTVIK